MSVLLSQLRALRRQIKIPYRIVLVDEEIFPEQFEEKVIYLHIWI